MTISKPLAKINANHFVKKFLVLENSKNKKKIGPKLKAKIICNQFKI